LRECQAFVDFRVVLTLYNVITQVQVEVESALRQEVTKTETVGQETVESPPLQPTIEGENQLELVM
jgi:hypothetical protein